MKFCFPRTMASSVVAIALAALSSAAQSAPAPTNQDKPTQQPVPNDKVIFSRSTGENGETTTQVGPAASQPSVQMANGPSAEDSDRQAVTITALNLDVHLNSAAHQIAARAQVTVRNEGKASLSRIPLQISSSLNWEEIRIEGHGISFPVATLNSDADHTGQLHEATVPLTQPLSPGATLDLDVAYSGTITPNAQRLVTIGTPEPVALHSDWDEISTSFTGLRGFGNVVWYPVSSVPVILGDGARLFDEIGRHKLRNSGTRFSLHLTDEFPHDQPPNVALINGHPVALSTIALSITDARGSDSEVSGIATARVDNVNLGFETPSIFIAIRKAHTCPNVTAWATPDNEVAVRTWLDAAATVTPFLERWLGQHPNAQLTLLDLPDPDDTPSETGAMLAASLHEAPADRLGGVLAHALTHAYTSSGKQISPAWLNEGLATFMESLWVEKRRGRDQALEMLESDRSALALAEPPSPGTSSGQPLAISTEPVYYRTKAAYVFWMLRDLTSDDALAAALQTCSGASSDQVRPSSKDQATTSTCPLQKLLKQSGAARDLSWFFSDWVDADRGLPDLAIEGVFPNAAQNGTYLVAVRLANAGYAAAEVPVAVRTAKNTVTERVLVPARGKAVQRVLVTGQPTQVQVNDGTVPEIGASVHVTDLDQTSSSQLPAGTSSSSQQPAQPPQ
jgi:hypothetical protein